MNLKEELQTLKENYNSPKLETVKTILKRCASEGKNTTTLDPHLYDKWIMNWLEAQDLEVKEVLDQRNGDFLRVTW